MRRLPRIDRSKVRTVPARRRPSKVSERTRRAPSRRVRASPSSSTHCPTILGGADLRAAIAASARAKRRDKTILWGFGAHLIKVGLAPIVVDLMERGRSERPDDERGWLRARPRARDDGAHQRGRRPGARRRDASAMARETAERLNGAIARGRGRRASAWARRSDATSWRGAIPTASARCSPPPIASGIPVTVHVAIGTDIHHMHPSADGAALGETSYRDFETLDGARRDARGRRPASTWARR